jgi:hypothetical protein
MLSPSESPMPSSGPWAVLHRAGWAGPVVGVVVAIALGTWVYGAVGRSVGERVGASLAALATAQAEAVRLAAAAGGGTPTPEALARIAAAGTPGETGETLIFDADARLVAPTRFDAALRTSGRIPQTTGLDLRDPGEGFAEGRESALARRSMALTKMAGLATSGRDGSDLDGYVTYRGVTVVGAWRWIPELRLGVAAEVERNEAYAPLVSLQRTFIVLALLAVGGATAGILVARRNASLLRKMREAESKLRTLGQYTLIRRIGSGGMGEVYLARHAMLRRPTAVKLLRPESTSEQAIARFEREVQQTSRLTHPNTVQIYDFGRTPGGTFYYAMEYLVGVPLDKFVAQEGPLEEGRVIYILQQVCASLNEAHELGLVHRDIKPDNIVLCRAAGAFDVAKVLDFGLVMDLRSDEAVKLSAAGAMLGTPTYMSPEAFVRPDSVDARSDIYSLGAVGYLLLTGHAPFESKSVVELFHAHTKQKPVPPSERANRAILPDVENAILACLEKDPALRPKSANALARELEWCQSADDWNRDKARYWWQEHEKRLEERYGLSTMARVAPAAGHETMEIRLDGR